MHSIDIKTLKDHIPTEYHKYLKGKPTKTEVIGEGVGAYHGFSGVSKLFIEFKKKGHTNVKIFPTLINRNADKKLLQVSVIIQY